MSAIQQQLRKALEDRRTKEKVDGHLTQLDARILIAHNELGKLAKALEKEMDDFEKLEKLSLKGLFYKVLGSKEEQMEKEKQEYLQASLKYDEVKKELDLMEFERNVLEEKRGKLQGIEEKADVLMQKRENEILRSRTKASHQLLDILKKIETHQLYEKEVNEAGIAGEKAVQVLHEVASFLQRARNWGNWDMMGRRGQMSSYVKHSNIDRARQKIAQAQHQLNRFEDELRDVYQDVEDFRVNFNIGIGGFARFADLFFDNLISDWVVQKKIQNALGSVTSIRDRVIRINQSLGHEAGKLREEIRDLEASRKGIILK